MLTRTSLSRTTCSVLASPRSGRPQSLTCGNGTVTPRRDLSTRTRRRVWVFPNRDTTGLGRGVVPVGMIGMGNWSDCLPSHPRGRDEVDPAAYESKERLKRMDEYGIAVQLICASPR